MKAGDFRSLGSLQKPADTRDAAGQPTGDFLPVANVWSDIRTVSGLRTISDMQGGGVGASITRYSIRIRYRSDVTFGWRFVVCGQVFDVKQVQQDFAKHQYTDLICELGNVQ